MPGRSGMLARAGAQPRDALKWSPCLDSKGVLFPGTSDQRTLCEDSEPLLPCLCRTHERRRPIPAGEEAGKAVSFRSKQRRRVTSTRPPWVEMETAPAEGSDRGLSTDTRLLPEAIAKGSGLHVLLLGSRRRCPPRELGGPLAACPPLLPHHLPKNGETPTWNVLGDRDTSRSLALTSSPVLCEGAHVTTVLGVRGSKATHVVERGFQNSQVSHGAFLHPGLNPKVRVSRHLKQKNRLQNEIF